MREKRKGISLFYKVLLGVLLALLLVFVYIRFGLLRPWLTRFEAAQPRHTGQQVFDDLFSPADWGRVYDLAGLEGGAYRDREGFIQAMEELTEGRELTLVETSAGLSGDRRYLVKAGADSVAAFNLTNASQDGMAVWKLGSVEPLLGVTAETVYIKTLAGQRVLVDGTELGEDCQVRLTETAAERYLPEGVYGRRTVLWQAQVGSAQRADITVLEGNGGAVPLTYDSDSGCFLVEEPADEPAAEERTLLIGAAECYARFMIRQSDAAQLRRYFDSESGIYQTIRSSEIWIKNTAGHSFSNEEISEFYRYGEDIFSARVSLHLDVKRGNGSAKPYEVDSTFFCHKKDGVWRVYDMTNVDVQEEIVHTRLVFMDGERELGRQFVSSQDSFFTPPAVDPPAGQSLTGWAVREQEGNKVTMTVRFQPGEDGNVTLPAGYELEPMTLYAVFE